MTTVYEDELWKCDIRFCDAAIWTRRACPSRFRNCARGLRESCATHNPEPTMNAGSEPNLFDMLLEQIRQIVRQEVAALNETRHPTARDDDDGLVNADKAAEY